MSGTRSTGLTSGTTSNATTKISWGQPDYVTSVHPSSYGVLHNFLNRVNRVAWLNESLPASTTAKYSVAPFTVDNADRATYAPDETLTTSTLLHETDILCQPANVVPSFRSSAGATKMYNITNSQGFNLQVGAGFEAMPLLAIPLLATFLGIAMPIHRIQS